MMARSHGVPSTSFLGISYGSLLGATYAELFPERVGRMVLDGAVDASGEWPLVSLTGLEEALGHFANWCAEEASCGLGDSGSAVLEHISQLLQRLDQEPLSVGQRILTQSLAARGVAGSLYWGRQHYPALAGDIGRAIEHHGHGVAPAGLGGEDVDLGEGAAEGAVNGGSGHGNARARVRKKRQSIANGAQAHTARAWRAKGG